LYLVCPPAGEHTKTGTSLHCVLQYGDSPCVILSFDMSYSLLRLAVLVKTGIEEVDIFRDVLVV